MLSWYCFILCFCFVHDFALETALLPFCRFGYDLKEIAVFGAAFANFFAISRIRFPMIILNYLTVAKVFGERVTLVEVYCSENIPQKF